MRKILILSFLGLSLLALGGCSPLKDEERQYADAYHNASRDQERIVNSWMRFCEGEHKVLSMQQGQTEPHCNPVPNTQAPAPAPSNSTKDKEKGK